MLYRRGSLLNEGTRRSCNFYSSSQACHSLLKLLRVSLLSLLTILLRVGNYAVVKDNMETVEELMCKRWGIVLELSDLIYQEPISFVILFDQFLL